VQQRTLHQSALGPLLHQFEMSGARGPQVPGVSVALNLCHALPSEQHGRLRTSRLPAWGLTGRGPVAGDLEVGAGQDGRDVGGLLALGTEQQRRDVGGLVVVSPGVEACAAYGPQHGLRGQIEVCVGGGGAAH